MLNELILVLALCLLLQITSAKAQSVTLIEQRAIGEVVGRTLNDHVNDLKNYARNGGVIRLTNDSLIFKCHDKNTPERFNFELGICEILSIDKFSWAGVMPNRIRITTKEKIFQIGTWRQGELIHLTRKRMKLCKEK